ncbi:centrosomal protein of 68 kDa [Vanacampus margaritifer]
MTSYPMDTAKCSRPWKAHVPDACVRHRMRLNATDIASEKRATEWAKEQPHKSVTVAPTSRYLTDGQYVMRKPLISIEQSSILKKTRHQQRDVGPSKTDENQHSTKMNLPTRLGDDLNPVSIGFTPTDDPPKDVRSSPLGVTDVGGGLQHEESFVGSTLTGSHSFQCGIFGNNLKFQKNDSPVRPQLTSTVLYPTYSPTPHFFSKRDQKEVKKQNSCFLSGQSRRQSMSYHEANYWDCAIPKSFPTSTNRHDASWNPNKEYQALLDYTYPLRPGQMNSKWDSTAFQPDSLQQDLNLEDSGIGLDNIGTTSLSESDLNLRNAVQANAWDRMDPEINSTCVDSSTLVFRSLSSGLLLDSLDVVLDKDVVNCHRHLQCAQPSSSIAFIRTTSVLPQSQSVGGDFDKEFCSLPDHLEEMQILTKQVKEVTARLNRPLTAMCECMDSNLPTRSQPEEELAKAANANSEAARTSPSSWLESDRLEEVETLAEQLCGSHLKDTRKVDQNVSLAQHIRMFCSLLEQYIHWLYKVSDKMDMSARPKVDIDNVKRSLAQHQTFQQELSSHQQLTSRILQTGELLLRCMDGASPLLRNTLLLIARQSRATECHSSSMDNQTRPHQPSETVEQDKMENPDPAGTRVSTK